MIKLQPVPGSELSAYVIGLLAKHDISSIKDFMIADTKEISKISNLDTECVEKLKAKLFEMNRIPSLNLLQHYKNHKVHSYGFGIESLDLLLGSQTFNSGSVFEIYGPCAIGKTKFCHTVALNLVRTCQMEALYIDTKQDFSGCCLYKMMLAQNMEKKECGEIMQRIKVEQTFSLDGVLNILNHLEASLRCGDALVTAIKLVIIDSLPAVWFTLNGDDERLERKNLLCKIANLLHKLAKEHSIAILLVNLAVQEDENYVENDDLFEFGPNAIQPHQLPETCSNDLLMKPALGRYWCSVPHTRLFMKMPDDVDEYSDDRVIEITRHSYGPEGGICRVHINDAAFKTRVPGVMASPSA